MSKKKKPLWKLEDGVTFSSLSKWMDCPEQFSLQWIDGLTPKRLNIAIEFGSVFHHALQNQFLASPENVVDRVVSQYARYRSQSITSYADRAALGMLLGLVKVTFPQYCSYWHTSDQALTWIGREKKFEVTHIMPDGRPITLRGMRDGLYETGNTFGIFETKTKSKVVTSEIEAALAGDMQTLFYAYCTYLDTGKYPNQVLYNVIRRAETYRRKGERLNAWFERVDEDIRCRPDHYFKRFIIDVSVDDIQRFVTESLNPILVLFCQWYDDVKKNKNERWLSKYHYRNYNALVGKYGKTEMWDAIFGDLSPYHSRMEVFSELEDSFQVTWNDPADEVDFGNYESESDESSGSSDGMQGTDSPDREELSPEET